MKLQLVAAVLFIGCILAPSLAAPLWEEGEATAVLQVIQMLLESENHGHGETEQSEHSTSATSAPSSQSSNHTGFTQGCVTAGYNGCCTDGDCRAASGCYCDVSCFNNDTCCQDIVAAGCHPRGLHITNGTNTTGKCNSNYHGCCTPAGTVNCLIQDCWCDALCPHYNNCCDDFGQLGATTSTCSIYDSCLSSQVVERMGCCKSKNGRKDCFTGKCYCDQDCHHHGDCCSDILWIDCNA